jgi:glutamate formiminotransferase / 5-formyltetrahydrofolate cyclo-ligase
VLLGVPNFSEGRDEVAIESISSAFGTGTEILDRHSDPIHNRTVLSLAGEAGGLAGALADGAAACAERIDLTVHDGAHPRVGALDVCPVVFVVAEDRELAREEALAAGAAIGDLGIPVFLYGELARTPERRERAYFRRGGPSALGARIAEGLAPDFGPPDLHPTAGATRVTARPPLAAFTVLLGTGELEVAVAIAAELREAGGGLPGVRAIAVDLDGRAQVSMNVHDPVAVPLATVAERLRELAEAHGVEIDEAELVGLVPEAAMRGFPGDLAIPGFDPALHLIEGRLG